MLYGKIKKSANQHNLYKNGKYQFTLIVNELFTLNEIKRYSIPEKCYEIVNYPKNQSYYCFGCRYNVMQDSYRFNN